MIPIRKALSTSVGKKYLMAGSGVALIGFIVTHLLGNLSLYAGPDAFNGYAAKLASIGPGLYVAEIGLIVIFLTHFITAVSLQLDKKRATPTKYAVVQKSKGGNSHLSFASSTMFWTGLTIILFVVYHVGHFKFGVFDSPELLLKVENASPHLDLYSRVQNAFQFSQPHFYIYMVVMTALGIHLSHGAWSWIQSIGMVRPDISKPLYTASIITGVVLAVGFLAIPLFFAISGGQ